MYIAIKVLDCTYIKHITYKKYTVSNMCEKRMHQAAWLNFNIKVKYKLPCIYTTLYNVTRSMIFNIGAGC